jgi:hypothetical protein
MYEEKSYTIRLTILCLLAALPLLSLIALEGNPACASPQSAPAASDVTTSRWADRFILASMLQGTIAVGLTAYLLHRGIFGHPAASRIVAAGGVGNWLIVGYFGYMVLGLLATAIMAMIYRHIEVDIGRPYTGWINGLGWAHLVLMNVGVTGATWLMMQAGYRGGAAMLPPNLGGQGLTPGQLHAMLKAYPPYIAIFMAMALLGVLLGSAGYILAWWAPPGILPSCP